MRFDDTFADRKTDPHISFVIGSLASGSQIAVENHRKDLLFDPLSIILHTENRFPFRQTDADIYL